MWPSSPYLPQSAVKKASHLEKLGRSRLCDRDVLLYVDGGVGGEEGWSNDITKSTSGAGAQNTGRG
jgi:hypothetical protein